MRVVSRKCAGASLQTCGQNWPLSQKPIAPSRNRVAISSVWQSQSASSQRVYAPAALHQGRGNSADARLAAGNASSGSSIFVRGPRRCSSSCRSVSSHQVLLAVFVQSKARTMSAAVWNSKAICFESRSRESAVSSPCSKSHSACSRKGRVHLAHPVHSPFHPTFV